MKIAILIFTGFVTLYAIIGTAIMIYEHNMPMASAYFMAAMGYFGWFCAKLTSG